MNPLDVHIKWMLLNCWEPPSLRSPQSGDERSELTALPHARSALSAQRARFILPLDAYPTAALRAECKAAIASPHSKIIDAVTMLMPGQFVAHLASNGQVGVYTSSYT